MQDTFLSEFSSRGYYNQCTNQSELAAIMSKNKIKAYIGFDSTAPSLHVGSLMQIMCLRLLRSSNNRRLVSIRFAKCDIVAQR